MMVQSWCCCRRVTLTLAVWVTTIAAVAAVGEGGGGHSAASGSPSQQQQQPSVINQLERSLLSMFGMQHRPRVKKAAVPPYMMELYRRHAGFPTEPQQKESSDSAPFSSPSKGYSSNTVRSFIHKESPADSIYPVNRMRLHFNVTNIPTDEVLYTADLRLTHSRHSLAPEVAFNESKIPAKPSHPTKPHRRKRWSKQDIPFVHRVMVYDILRRATKTTEPTLRLLDTKVIDARQEGIQELDIFDALSRWMLEPKNNFGLLVDIVPLKLNNNTVDTSHVHLRRPAVDLKWHEKQPLLVARTNDSKEKARSKRSPVVKHKKTKNYCKRYPLYVDFRKVGWDDWIMAPPGYDAWFCKGDCPFPLSEEMNATNHAVVQTLVNSRYPDRVPKACCVPTELSAISMLYMDDDERFVLKNHQDMVVEGCGCR